MHLLEKTEAAYGSTEGEPLEKILFQVYYQLVFVSRGDELRQNGNVLLAKITTTKI
jgi:hypothetical protein